MFPPAPDPSRPPPPRTPPVDPAPATPAPPRSELLCPVDAQAAKAPQAATTAACRASDVPHQTPPCVSPDRRSLGRAANRWTARPIVPSCIVCSPRLFLAASRRNGPGCCSCRSLEEEFPLIVDRRAAPCEGEAKGSDGAPECGSSIFAPRRNRRAPATKRDEGSGPESPTRRRGGRVKAPKSIRPELTHVGAARTLRSAPRISRVGTRGPSATTSVPVGHCVLGRLHGTELSTLLCGRRRAAGVGAPGEGKARSRTTREKRPASTQTSASPS